MGGATGLRLLPAICVGTAVGCTVGGAVGARVGLGVGKTDGAGVGNTVGSTLGAGLGAALGVSVGGAVWTVQVGCVEGAAVSGFRGCCSVGGAVSPGAVTQVG